MHKAILIVILMVFCAGSGFADSSDYKIIDWSQRLSVGYNPFYYDYLHLDLFSGGGFWQTRCIDPKNPGDYFSEPSADSSFSDSATSLGALDLYTQYINLNTPPESMNQIKWFSDTLHESTRNEYFLRYTDNKSVYAISGWWPKFIKYFLAIPGDFKYSQEELKTELKTIVKNNKIVNSMKFKEIVEGNLYLLESTFDNINIRNYKFTAKWYDGRSQAPDLGQPPPMFSDWYNIIEITIYLDKEFMP